jgi:hypothetical protein
MHAYIVVSLTTGLRTEEIRELRWDHVIAWTHGQWHPVTSAKWEHEQFAVLDWVVYEPPHDAVTARLLLLCLHGEPLVPVSYSPVGQLSGTTLRSVVLGKSSRAVQSCPRSGPIFQACRLVPIAGYGLGNSVGNSWPITHCCFASRACQHHPGRPVCGPRPGTADAAASACRDH